MPRPGSCIGAALLGIEGDEIVQGLLDMMYAKAPYAVIRRAMHIHPTVYEMILHVRLAAAARGRRRQREQQRVSAVV